MTVDDFEERIYRRLWSYFEARPGSIGETQDALGVCENYLRTQRRRRTLSVRRLVEVLAERDYPPALFFAQTFPSALTDAVTLFCQEAETLGPEPDAVERWRVSVGGAGGQNGIRTEVESELERLDSLRDDGANGARRAIAGAERLLATSEGNPALASRVLGIWGSSLRALGDYDTATVVLRRGIQTAAEHGAEEVYAELVQRASYVAALRTGDYARGLPLADLALLLFHELGCDRGVGTASIARGYMLHHLGRLDSARRCYRRALRFLAGNDRRNRFGVYQLLALALQEKGDVEGAVQCAERALADAPPGRDLVAKFRWWAARLAVTRGDLGRAEQLLRKVADALADLPVDATLATVELVRVLLLSSRPLEACTVARNMRKVVFMLPPNRMIEAAVADLIRAAVEGERDLTLVLVDDVAKRVERGRSEWSRPHSTGTSQGLDLG